MKNTLKFNCGVYKITNTVTGDFYIGSSKNLYKRLRNHRCKSSWRTCSKNPLYLDMQKYGLEKFLFEGIEECLPEDLKTNEQKWIEELKPTYNRNAAYSTKKGSDYVLEWERNHKEQYITRMKKYYQRDCLYKGEQLSYNALVSRLRKLGVKSPNATANKYVIG